MARGVHQPGVAKARRQLLLAAELTFDRERAERLAALAHRLGELAGGDGDPDTDAIDRIDGELTAVRTDTYPDVRDAIVRAQELLAGSRGPPAPA